MHAERPADQDPAPRPKGGPVVLERDGEVARFEDLLDDIASSHGHVLVIEGPSGIGKTALLRKLRDRAEQRGAEVLGARATDLEQSTPFAVLRQLLDRVAPVEIADTVVAPSSWPAGEGEQTPEGRLQQQLTRAVLERAADRPMVLLLDDAQWADAPSLRFLVHLATRLEWEPLGIALSRRTGDPATAPELLNELVSQSQVEEVRPLPLSVQAVAQLTEIWLTAHPDAAFAKALHGVTGGNPLFTVEMLRELRAEEVPPTSNGVAVVQRAGPRTVARSVLLHVGRLGAAACQFARAAAVLGDGCAHNDIAALAGLTPEAADRAYDALAEAGVLMASDGIRFRQPVVRNAVYHSHAPRELSALHARVVEVLRGRGADGDEIAPHLSLTQPAGDPAAAAALHAAARRALDRAAPATAARYLRRALEEPPDETRRLELVHDLADALLRTGDMGAIRWVDRALAQGLDTERRARLTQRAAELLALRSRRNATVTETLRELPGHVVLQAMVQECPASELTELAIATLSQLDVLNAAEFQGASLAICATALTLADRTDAADRPLARAARAAAASGAAPPAAMILGVRAFARFGEGRLAEAQEDVTAALTAARSARLDLILPMLAATEGLIRLETHGPPAAFEVVRDIGPPRQPSTFASRILEARATIQLAAGRPREALADAEGAGRTPVPYGRWRALASLAHLALGDHDAAGDLADAHLARAREFGAPREVGAALRLRARLADGDSAEAYRREAVAVLEHSQDRLELAGALVDLGAHLRRDNRRVEARCELHRGQALAIDCGAGLLAERAATELSATGARARVVDRATLERLTASERRVAELAAAGRSNPQIASELVVTRKTVELHLTNAYRKLGIRSRAELADALGR